MFEYIRLNSIEIDHFCQTDILNLLFCFDTCQNSVNMSNENFQEPCTSTGAPKKQISNYHKRQLLAVLQKTNCHPKEVPAMATRFKVDESTIKRKNLLFIFIDVNFCQRLDFKNIFCWYFRIHWWTSRISSKSNGANNEIRAQQTLFEFGWVCKEFSQSARMCHRQYITRHIRSDSKSGKTSITRSVKWCELESALSNFGQYDSWISRQLNRWRTNSRIFEAMLYGK